MALTVALYVLDVAEARAEVSRGHYRLDQQIKTQQSWAGSTLPSCGKDADAFVTTFGAFSIAYGETAKVNGHNWAVDSKPDDQVTLIDRTSKKPLIILITFWRRGQSTAGATVSVIGLSDNGVPRCGDAIWMKGSYSRELTK